MELKDLKRVKKRYIVGAVVIVFLLWRCSGSDEEERYSQRQDVRDLAPMQQDVQQPQIVQPQAQPVIVNNVPSQGGSNGFLEGLMVGHILNQPHNSYSTAEREDRDYARMREANRQRNAANLRRLADESRQTAAAKPIKQPSSNWSQPSATARSYSVSAPKPTTMTKKTWATSTSKGWGSSNSYKSSSTSYKASRSSSSSRRR